VAVFFAAGFVQNPGRGEVVRPDFSGGIGAAKGPWIRLSIFLRRVTEPFELRLRNKDRNWHNALAQRL